MLDAAFARGESFPRLNKKANLAHIVFDYGLSPQCSDEEIYQKATLENRLVLTINFKDFRKLVKNNKSGVVAIPSELSNENIDSLLSEFVSGKNPQDYYGKAAKVLSD